ncbi:MAG: amidohydrolase [Proteobacteria bacterium]|nr:amidohydrolase [Pseudomonadota bacterium]HQR03005.1 amidohydrolase [Rhodocyclaceae bacterium]
MKLLQRFRTVLLILLAASVLGALVIYVVWRQALPPPPARQLFVHGVVLTVDANDRVASAVAIEGDHIVAVGDSDDLLQRYGQGAEVHDLKGRTLIPGFIDAHSHFPSSGLAAVGVDLNSPPIGTLTSLAELQARLRDRVATLPKGQWLFGFGYDDSLIQERRHPTRQDLDAVSTDHPIYVFHISGHMGVVNSLGLKLAGINRNTPNPPGGIIVHDSQGEPTGLLQENAGTAVQKLAMNFGALDFLKMVRQASADYATQGVTTAQNGATDSRTLKALTLASQTHLIPMRLEIWPLWNELGRNLLEGKVKRADLETDRISVGPIKFFTDGSIQGYTGYLGHPYHQPYHGDKDYRGFPTMPPEELRAWVKRYHDAGFQLALHSNGDAAIDEVLDAIAAAQKDHPLPDIRHILVHAQMSRLDQIERMSALSVTPSFFSAHTYYWGDRHRDIFLGPERARNISPTRWAKNAGLRFSVHLDTPVVPMNPRLLWWSTVNRLSSSGRPIGPEQGLTVMEALRAMTADAAWQIHREAQIGSIEPGKLADLVVLSEDPRSAKDLRDMQVMRTVVGGTTIYSR